jgi:hypothetical protein
VSIFKKLIKVQQQHKQFSCANFHLHRTRNVGSRYSLLPSSKVIGLKLSLHWSSRNEQFVDISCSEFRPNRRKTVERAKLHLRPDVKFAFHFSDFHETHKCSTVLHGDLYRTLPKSVINSLTARSKVWQPIFTKLTPSRTFLENNSYTWLPWKFYKRFSRW